MTTNMSISVTVSLSFFSAQNVKFYPCDGKLLAGWKHRNVQNGNETKSAWREILIYTIQSAKRGAELRTQLATQQKSFRLPARVHSQLWKMAVNQRNAAAISPGFLQKQINISPPNRSRTSSARPNTRRVCVCTDPLAKRSTINQKDGAGRRE